MPSAYARSYCRVKSKRVVRGEIVKAVTRNVAWFAVQFIFNDAEAEADRLARIQIESV